MENVKVRLIGFEKYKFDKLEKIKEELVEQYYKENRVKIFFEKLRKGFYRFLSMIFLE
jgi:nucleoside diphosphate kinase